MFGSREINTFYLVRQNISEEVKCKRRNYFQREYPHHVPAFVQYGHDHMIHKYVLPRDSSFVHFLVAFRRKLQLNSTEALMALIEKYEKNKDGKEVVKSFQITCHKTIGDLADEYLNPDGYLYINVTIQHTFG